MPPEKIKFNFKADNIFLNIDTAIPCGLIINELATNSLKYAFPNDKTGEINIVIRSIDDGFELIVSDNGIGLPQGFNIYDSTTLGLKLVTGLVGQLKGEMEIKREYGTMFQIKFNTQ